MIGPRTSPPLWDRLLEFARGITLSAAELEERRVSFIHGQMGGVISREEIRRIVRAHRL